MPINTICFLKNLTILYAACIPTIIGLVVDNLYRLNGIGLLIGGMITMILLLFAIDKTKKDAKNFYRKTDITKL